MAFIHCDLTLLLPLKKILLVKAVLDTTMRGSDVDTSLLLTCDNDGNQSSLTVGGSNISADEPDYASTTKPTDKCLYKLICDSNVEVSICTYMYKVNAVHFWRAEQVHLLVTMCRLKNVSAHVKLELVTVCTVPISYIYRIGLLLQLGIGLLCSPINMWVILHMHINLHFDPSHCACSNKTVTGIIV